MNDVMMTTTVIMTRYFWLCPEGPELEGLQANREFDDMLFDRRNIHQ